MSTSAKKESTSHNFLEICEITQVVYFIFSKDILSVNS
jgi:hypothetical protein